MYLRPARAKSVFIHFPARAEIAHLGILRRAERARVDTITAANALILGMQHDAIRGRVNALDRTNRLAGRIGAVHTGHGHRTLARLAVIDRDNAPTIEPPRHLVFVLAGGRAGVALEATIGVAKKLHPGHARNSLGRRDLTEGDLGFLHVGHRIVAIGRHRVGALTEHKRVGALRVFAALIDSLEPAGEMVRHPRHPLADAFGDERFHARLRSVFRTRHPNPSAILDPALEGIRRADLDVHVLAQLGEPPVGPGFLAAAFVIDEPAGTEDERELFRDTPVDSALLNREADIRHAELLGVRQRRIFADKIDAR